MSTPSSEDNDVPLTQTGEPSGSRKWNYIEPSKKALRGALVVLSAAAIGMGAAAQPAQASLIGTITQGINQSVNDAIANVTGTIKDVQDAAQGAITVIVPTQPNQPLTILDQIAQGVQDAQEFQRSLAEVQQAIKDTNSVDLNTVLAAVINGGGSQLADEYGIQVAGPGGSNGGADGTQSTGTGIAMVAPENIELVPTSIYQLAGGAYTIVETGYNALNFLGIGDQMPALGQPAQADGTATISGNGYHVAFATTGGDAFAHSSSGGLATAGASDGRTAYAFTIGGLAHAWNTDDVGATLFGNSPSQYPSATGPFGDLLGLTIQDPTVLPGVQQVDAFGGISFAYADDVGAAVNVGGLFDASAMVHPDRSLQVALTDPTAAVYSPQDVLGTVVSDILAGQSPVLTKDFVRLSTDGSSSVALTSGYGFSDSVVMHWLGSTFTFAPLVEINGQWRPNYLALPVYHAGTFDLGELIPSFDVPSFDLPFGLPSIDPQGTGAGATPATGTTGTVAPAPTVTARSAVLPAAVQADEPDNSAAPQTVTVAPASEVTSTGPTLSSTESVTATDTSDSTSQATDASSGSTADTVASNDVDSSTAGTVASSDTQSTESTSDSGSTDSSGSSTSD